MKNIGAVVLVVAALAAATDGHIVLAALLLGAVLVMSRIGGNRLAVGHSHPGSLRHSARHEGGHAAAARALYGRVTEARLYPDGSGYVEAYIPDNPHDRMVFALAGAAAVGDDIGAQDDLASVERTSRLVPRGEREAIRRSAERAARNIVRQHAPQIERDAATLLRYGKL